MVTTAKMNSTFAELGMEPAFIEQAERLGLRTIADMMAVNLKTLKKHPAFTYMWYISMLELLKQHDLLKKLPGDQL